MSYQCPKCLAISDKPTNFCNMCGTPFNVEIHPSTPIPKKKSPVKKALGVTSAIALLVAIAFLSNQFLRPLIQGNLPNETSRTSSKKDTSSNQGEDSDEKAAPSTSAEGIVNDEINELVTESNVRMILSPLSINGDAVARISPREFEKPADHITLNMYEFELESDVPLEGIVTLEIPYRAEDLPKGYEAEQCLVGLYYNDDTDSWEDVHYTIDTSREVVVIKTEHLSPFGYAINDNPELQPISGGTVDLSGNQIFTSSNTWVDAPNYGAYYTDLPNTRFERAIKYDFETAKALSQEQNLDAIMEQISTYGVTTPNQVLIDTGASFLGTLESYPEHSSTAIMFSEIYSSERLQNWNQNLSNFGAAVAFFQLSSDLYYEKPFTTTAYNFLKSMTYWKGAAAVKEIAGTAAGSYFSIALVALFFIEQFIGPIDSWDDHQYSQLPEHKKLFGAYTAYYDARPVNGGAYRSVRDWSAIIDELNTKALTDTTVTSEQRETYFAQLVKEEIERYTQAFWNLPLEEKVTKVINNQDGYLYGKWGLIHYEGNANDPEILVSEYVDKISNDEVKGMSLSFAEAQSVKLDAGDFLMIGPGSNESSARSYLNFFDTQEGIYSDIKKEMTSTMYNYIFNQRIQPLMAAKKEANYINRENILKKNLDQMMVTLNTVITLNYIGATEDEPVALYPNHIVAPISSVLKNNGTLADWAVTLDKDGNGTLGFTTLAHLQSGAFNQLGIYAPEDADKLETAKPIAVINFIIDGNTSDVYLNQKKFPTLEELAGTWNEASMTITRFSMSEEFKEMLAGLGEDYLNEALAGCDLENAGDLSDGTVSSPEELNTLEGKVFPVSMTILRAGSDIGTFSYQQLTTKEDADFELLPTEIPFTYTEGVLKGDVQMEGTTMSMELNASYEGRDKVKLEGVVKINYGSGMLEIDLQFNGTNPYVPAH